MLLLHRQRDVSKEGGELLWANILPSMSCANERLQALSNDRLPSLKYVWNYYVIKWGKRYPNLSLPRKTISSWVQWKIM